MTAVIARRLGTMITIVPACLCTLAFLAASLCYGATVSEKERWESARKTNSITGYAAFLKEFPNTDKKKELSGRVDSLIISRITKEIKERNAKVYDKGLNGTNVLPLTTTLKAGGALAVSEEVQLGAGIHAFPDPANPMELRSVPDPSKKTSQVLELVGGRGAILQEYQGRIAYYVFGLDLSSLIASWEKIPVDKFYYLRGVPIKK